MTAGRLSSWDLLSLDPARRNRTVLIVVAGTLIAGAIGALAAASLLLTCGLLVSSIVFVAVYHRPQLAAYIYLFLSPLVTGFDRGVVIPLLRPNEALLGLLVGALLLRRVVRWIRGEPLRINVSRLELALFIVVVLGSVISIGWMAARAFTPNSDDLLHALVFWKYLVLYVMIRASITTSDQVRRCIWIILAANSAVALIAILQAFQIAGINTVIASIFTPGDEARALAARGTSTLAHSIAVGDVMAMSLALAMGLLIRGQSRRGTALALAALFLLGGVASGQFSGFIALVTVVVAIGVVTGRLLQVGLLGAPALAAGAFLMMPAVSRRLAGFSGGTLPQSWVGRWDNLTQIVWPRMFRDWSWVLGVRTSPRIPAWESWRDFVYIESGHTWMLWVGGIPLLLAFLYFSFFALRAAYRVARQRTDIVGVAAIGAFAGASIVFVLSVLDHHFTVRGTADLWFPLLAIAFASIPGSPETARGGAESEDGLERSRT